MLITLGLTALFLKEITVPVKLFSSIHTWREFSGRCRKMAVENKFKKNALSDWVLSQDKKRSCCGQAGIVDFYPTVSTAIPLV